MRLFTFLLSLLSIITLAQDGINYQGVATNGSAVELINQNISIKASIISDSTTGTVQWQEIHNTTTDQFGLFNVVIGQGSSTGVGQTTNFDNVDWGSSNHYLRIEMDATGASNYSLISTSQMMSVPYALYAKSAGIDSTMLANMIGTSVGGMGGGCNYQFPDGLNGEAISTNFSTSNQFIVPTGKRLYILSCPVTMKVNNVTVSSPQNGTFVVCNPGDVVVPDNSSSYYFNGILVDAVSDVNAISTNFSTSNQFIVPTGKRLYILSCPVTMKVNNVTVSSPQNGTFVVCNAGDIVVPDNSTSYYFNGYLVDENYFANCGGGSSSSSASVVDSAMVAGMIANSVGGCNLKFPDGLEGFSINKTLNNNLNYIVPQSKRLYIIFKNGNTTLYINNIGVNYYGANFSSPIIANAGDTIWSSNTCNIHGFIVEEKSQISAKSMTLNTLNYPHLNYIVPQSKRFYITSKTGNVSLYVNNEIINYYGANFNTPKIVNAGDTIHSAGTAYINGFLVDEGYFSNCGGGISSSSNNSNNINVSQYGDTLYINGQAVVVPGVSQSNLNYHFHNYGSVMDADSNIYRTLIYGNDEWMVENLKTQIGSFTTPASDPNLPTYIQADSIGYYYSTSDLNNACPIGWHVSSVSDWQDLHYEIFGTSMNPTGFTSSANGYDDNNYQILWSQYLNATTPGTNQSAFNLFRTGFWNNSINGVEQEDRASFWTTTGCSSGNNYLINLSENGFTLDVGCTSAGNVKAQVRCVKD